jgi:hypothetical protein
MGRLTGRRFHKPQEVPSRWCWITIYCVYFDIINTHCTLYRCRYLNLLDLLSTRPFLLGTGKRVCRYLNVCILDLLTRRSSFLGTEKQMSFLSWLRKRFASPFKFWSLGDVRKLTNSSYPIGVFKQSGTSLPKYSNPICQLTLHCMVEGRQTQTHVDAECWFESSRKQADTWGAGLVHQGQNTMRP